MKKLRNIILLLPLALSRGACSTDDKDINLSSIINNGDIDDIAKSFVYDASMASNQLNAMAQKDGYSFDIRLESQILPDPSNVSRFYDVTLNGKGDATWATVNELDVDGNILNQYEALLEESTGTTYYKNGDNWEEIPATFPYAYSIQDLKGLLLVSGTYVPLLAITGVVKVRTVEINRECIKYTIPQEGENDKLVITVDRATQLLTHLTEIHYSSTSVSKNIYKMNAFRNSAPAVPEYK